MLRLAEDDCPAAESTASRSFQSGLDLYLRLRGLQLGAHAQPGGRSSGRVSPGRRVSGWAWIRPRGPEQSEINSLDITHDEKRQEKHRIHQFFSSLLNLSTFVSTIAQVSVPQGAGKDWLSWSPEERSVFAEAYKAGYVS